VDVDDNDDEDDDDDDNDDDNDDDDDDDDDDDHYCPSIFTIISLLIESLVPGRVTTLAH